MGAATATQSTLLETTECRQKQLNNEFNQPAAYLAKEKALKGLYKALGRIYNVYKRATAQATTDTIHSLQEAVQKLTDQIEAKPTRINASGLGTSYTAAAQWGAAAAAAAAAAGVQSCM
jgi:hypothetical protein